MKIKMPREPHSFLMSAQLKTAHASDYFVCLNCGHSAFLKIRGDSATCSQCGGTMKRSGT